MRFLKILLAIIVILGLGYVLFCFMGPKSMAVQRSMVMNGTPGQVYEEITDFTKWDAWSPWSEMDSAMVTTNEGEGVGAVMSWTSDNQNVGNGSQEIVDLKTNEYMRTKLNFGEFENHAEFILEGMGDSTKVTWTLEEYEIPFLGRGLMKMMDFEGIMNNTYDSGLTNLKAVVEAKPKGFVPPPFEIVEKMNPEMIYLSTLVKTNMESLQGGSVHAEAYGKIGQVMGVNELKFGGAPFCLIHEMNEETGDMTLEFAIPVEGEIKELQEGVDQGVLEAGKVVSAVHYGPYDTVGPTWERVEAYTKENNMEMRGFPYEMYINDPQRVESENEIQTEIAFQVK